MGPPSGSASNLPLVVSMPHIHPKCFTEGPGFAQGGEDHRKSYVDQKTFRQSLSDDYTADRLTATDTLFSGDGKFRRNPKHICRSLFHNHDRRFNRPGITIRNFFICEKPDFSLARCSEPQYHDMITRNMLYCKWHVRFGHRNKFCIPELPYILEQDEAEIITS